MKRIGNATAVILGGISLAGILSGCGSMCCKRNEIAELKQTVSQQQDLAKLRAMLEANTELLKKINASRPAAQSLRDRMTDAALLLAENGSDNIAVQAVTILGSLGGDKAEAALIAMLDSKSSISVSIFQALANMRSKKIHDLAIKQLQEGDINRAGNMVNILNNQFYNILSPADVPVIEKLLDTIPDNNYNNHGYVRNCLLGVLLRISPERGMAKLCDALQTTTESHRQREIIYQLTSYGRKVNLNDWRKIIDILGPISETNAEGYSAILNGFYQTGDWRVTDIILPWADFARTNRNFGNSYLNTLLRLRDPKTAKLVLELCKDKEYSRSYGRNLNNFPGIRQLDNNNFVLVGEAELEKLIAERDKVVARLEARDKKIAESKK